MEGQRAWCFLWFNKDLPCVTCVRLNCNTCGTAARNSSHLGLENIKHSTCPRGSVSWAVQPSRSTHQPGPHLYRKHQVCSPTGHRI